MTTISPSAARQRIPMPTAKTELIDCSEYLALSPHQVLIPRLLLIERVPAVGREVLQLSFTGRHRFCLQLTPVQQRRFASTAHRFISECKGKEIIGTATNDLLQMSLDLRFFQGREERLFKLERLSGLSSKAASTESEDQLKEYVFVHPTHMEHVSRVLLKNAAI